MTRPLSALLICWLAGFSVAQNLAFVPSACRTLPGNAAVSMPLRWSQGTMQVLVLPALFPQGFVGHTITGIRMRRPSFLGEPAYPSLQRTLTVRGGMQLPSLSYLTPDLALNRPAGLNVLFGPAPVSIAATPATRPDHSVGDEFLVIPFTTPLVVSAGSLFLEFETGNAPLTVETNEWVDAVWFEDGVETGYAVTVGNGECTTRSQPTQLVWPGTAGPQVGGTANLELSGTAPRAFVFEWFGLDPEPRAVSGNYFGWGGDLGLLSPSLAGCNQWAPIDASWSGTASLAGTYSMSFALPAAFATIGRHIGVQTAWVDPARPDIPLSISNGVMLVIGNIGVGGACTTAFFPGTSTYSPWAPEVGLMPVLALDYN